MVGAGPLQKLPEICFNFKLQIIIDAHYTFSSKVNQETITAAGPQCP